MFKKTYSFLLSLFLMTSCQQTENDSDIKTWCPCDYPSWAQAYLQTLNTDKQRLFILFYYLSGDSPAYYAIVDVFESNRQVGVSFYDKRGNPILEGDPVYDDLFMSYSRTGGFAVCDHQFM